MAEGTHTYTPRVLCPECYAKIGGEEKTCSHMIARACTECGRDKRVGENAFDWSCVGWIVTASESGQHKGNEP